MWFGGIFDDTFVKACLVVDKPDGIVSVLRFAHPPIFVFRAQFGARVFVSAIHVFLALEYKYGLCVRCDDCVSFTFDRIVGGYRERCCVGSISI